MRNKDDRPAKTIQKHWLLQSQFPYPWLMVVAVITAFCLSPMLGNGFTNWDDGTYVVNNALLRGPDWKGIFTQPVSSNYHPLTVLSLAINYHFSSLDPFWYLLSNLFLHVVNTALVFYFTWVISNRKLWVAVLCGLLFGIHPMHVESVAWVSGRKDLLYTFFFLLSLIEYWRFILSGKSARYWFSFLLFVFSLLSKPAAVIVPVVLFLLDWLQGRTFSVKLVLEKLPFLVASVAIGIITLQMQSHTAMISLKDYSIGIRLLFACYAVMMYTLRFLLPLQLSAFHPYPPLNALGLPVLLSPLVAIALVAVLWYYRNTKWVLFGLLFFLVNLLLVLQLVSFGLAIVAERYTYVPYIGLALVLGMWLDGWAVKSGKVYGLVAVSVLSVGFGVLTFQRTKVWKNSETLWSDVITQYSDASVARNNRANYYSQTAASLVPGAEARSLNVRALADCDIALRAQPDDVGAHELRGGIYMQLGRQKEAIVDAEAMIQLAPDDPRGYHLRGKAKSELHQPDEAIADFNKCLALAPDDYSVLYDRGALLFNHFQKYQDALTDFDKAIELHPTALFYLSRSYCYYLLGSPEKARDNARIALQMGQTLPAEYRKALNL